jgi:3-oxoacyl-[acyl-carrier protein] reductase
MSTMAAKIEFDFDGARVVVTGGSSGIGLGIARAFEASNAKVAITGRRAAATDYDVDLSNLEYRQTEMTDDSSLDLLASSFDRIDVLVNNAGASLAAEDEWRPEVFERAVRIALFGSFRLATAFKDRLAKSRIDGGGSVLNMASMAAFRAVPIVPGYGAAKAAIVQMTKNMGAAWALENVRVNAVAPGLIETNMTSVMRGTPFADPEIDRTPMRRWGTPDDIAPAYLFLASPAARFITGQTLCVDGGSSIA